MKAVDQHIALALDHYAGQIQTHFQADVFSYFGPIHPVALPSFLEVIEALKASSSTSAGHNKNKLIFVLTTLGGVVECAEKMVEIMRHHYDEVEFVIPEYAMSAGTVLCMSGDRIWMDYASSLGPIDPQVQRQNNNFVPALGFIDKVKEFIEKSNTNSLSGAEVLMLRGLDLAELRRFEQARDLSITLLKQWLVNYKFKNWSSHQTTVPGSPVTQDQKEQRAEEIARHLSDNSKWHSHSRMIGMKTASGILRLKIDDYSSDLALRSSIRTYNSVLSEYVERQGSTFYIHTARNT